MTDETNNPPAPTDDESGRIRTGVSPATWTADEPRPETQPGVVQTETKPETTPEPPAPKPKKAA